MVTCKQSENAGIINLCLNYIWLQGTCVCLNFQKNKRKQTKADALSHISPGSYLVLRVCTAQGFECQALTLKEVCLSPQSIKFFSLKMTLTPLSCGIYRSVSYYLTYSSAET